MFLLKVLAKTAITLREKLTYFKHFIPTHIQSLTWVCVDSNEFTSIPIFEMMSPHWCWISQWDDGTGGVDNIHGIAPHPFVTLPSKGYFVWVIWDSKIARRRYICLRMSEFKDIFYDIETVNDLFAWQDRAILKRIHTFTYMDSSVHRKDNKLLDISITTTPCVADADNTDTPSQKTICILKTLQKHEMEDSIYIPKNLTGGALLWMYHFITQTLPTSRKFPETTITLTDYELEEKKIGFDEFIFA